MVSMVILVSMDTIIIQTRDVPDDLHKRFKMLCVEHGVSMNSKVIELIREFVEQGEKKGKK